MIANSRLYYFLLAGLIPMFLVGFAQVAYSFMKPGIFPFSSIEPIVIALVIIYDTLLILLVIIDYFLSAHPDELSLSRHVSEKLSINRSNSVILKLSNFSSQELTMIIKDDYPEIEALQKDEKGKKLPLGTIKINLPAGIKGEFEYFLKPNYRGDFEFGNINVRYLSRFKLFWRQVKFKLPQNIKVYPDLISLQELSFRLSVSSTEGETKLRKLGEGTEFSSLREYVVGDDIRRIDWRATARRDFPIVRTFEVSRDQTILILLDAGRMMSTRISGMSRFDWGLNAALSLSLAALTKGDQVGVGIFAERNLQYIPPKRGKTHLKNIIEGLHNIQPQVVEPDYVGVLANFASLQKKRALIVVITDLIDAIASNSLLTGMAHLSPRHLPFIVTFNDKKLLSYSNNQVNDHKDVYMQSVAIDLLDQRKQALNTLIRKGGLALDVPPEDLNNAIVDKYLTIKAKNMI